MGRWERASCSSLNPPLSPAQAAASVWNSFHSSHSSPSPQCLFLQEVLPGVPAGPLLLPLGVSSHNQTLLTCLAHRIVSPARAGTTCLARGTSGSETSRSWLWGLPWGPGSQKEVEPPCPGFGQAAALGSGELPFPGTSVGPECLGNTWPCQLSTDILRCH